MASKTVFQLSYKELYSWVEEVKTDRTSARCTLCKKTFYIGSMGRTALSSHANSKKHKAVVSAQSKSVGMGVYLKGSGKESTTITHPDCHLESGMVMGKTVMTSSSSESKSVLPSKSNSGEINQFLLHSDVTKAEVLWCLHTVMNHTSFRGSASCIPVFKLMFPDSEIAKKLQLQRTKLAYTIVYGLAPHFSEELQQLLNACDHIVVGFDESLNSVAQKQQMDIAVRFWDVTKSQVSTRYLTSVFLGNCTALDLLCAFKEALTSNLLPKVTQVSLDGPNVNLKFLKDLSEELRENGDGQVRLNMGTCGLHTIHGAFKTAINKTGWKIIEFLRALYYLFKDVPTRRSEYTRLTGSVMFPLKFCPIRWVENGKVVERASSMVPYLMKYVEYSQKEKKEPNCSSYNTMVEALKDKFLLPKLAFFESLSHMVEPFLRDFQNDAPMAPFLFFDLRALAVSFIKRIIYDDIKKVSTSALLNLTKTGKLIPDISR